MNQVANAGSQQHTSAPTDQSKAEIATTSSASSDTNKLTSLLNFLHKSWNSLSVFAENQYQSLASSREGRALKRVMTPNTASKLVIVFLLGGMYIIMMMKLIDKTVFMASYLEWNLIVAGSALLITRLRWLALHGAVLCGLAIMHAAESSMLLSLYVYLISFMVIWCKPYLKLLKPQAKIV